MITICCFFGIIDWIYKRKKVRQMVELDQFKQELLSYREPLAEVRDSL